MELLGRFEDSGFKVAPYLARRSDGQIIQLPELLYRLLEQIDGHREADELARRTREATGIGLDADGARFLVDERLRPVGLVAPADGSTPELRKVDPLLALKFRTAIVPERVTRALTSLFQPLFLPPAVVMVVVGMFALDAWLFLQHGVSQSIRHTIYDPVLLLALLAGMVVATAFHEIGHATACRYGGARPGVMGVGIYVVWPAFYTDVTDAYRLNRAGRLRTDLGGVYFNAVFALVVAGVYAVTRAEFLLLLVLLQNFAILQQLLPLLRLDGYYVISDLTGVPDIFTRIKPVLQSLAPWRGPHPRVAELKPRVRMAVTAYVCLIVPVLLGLLVLMVIHAPRVFATAYDSVGVQWEAVTHARGLAAGTIGVLQVALLVLPCVGMVLTSGRVARSAGRAAWTWSAGEPVRRAGLGAITVAGAAFVAFTWWPNGDYRPIQPGERGTLGGAIHDVLAIPSGRPALSAARALQLHGAPTELSRVRARERRQAGRATRDRVPATMNAITTPGTGTVPATEPPNTTTTPTTQTTPPPMTGTTTTQTTPPATTTTQTTAPATTTQSTPTQTTTDTTPTDTTPTTTTPTDTTPTTTTDTTTTPPP